MNLTLITDQSGQILGTPPVVDSSATVTHSSPEHLADLFTISQHYDAPTRQQWFEVICSRQGLPTAITLVGETLPAALTLLTHADNADQFLVSICSLQPLDVEQIEFSSFVTTITAAVKNSDLSFYIRNLDGRLRVIFGALKSRPQTPEQLKAGQSVFDLFSPESLALLQQNDTAVITANHPVQTNDIFYSLDAEQAFRSTKFALYDNVGTLEGIAGLTHAVSADTLALKQRSRNQQRTTRAIMSSPMAVVISDLATGVITDVNQGFIAKYGYEKESILGRSTVDIGLIRADDRAVFKKLVSQGDEVIREYFTFCKLDGTEVPVEATATVIEIDGEPSILSIAVDDSRAQAAERRLQLIADASFEGIVMHDKNTILEVNQTMCEIAGRSREELIGLAIWELIPASDRTAVREVSAEDSHVSYEFTIVRPDQSLRTVMTRSHDVTEGGQLYRITVMRDITDEQALKLQLHRAQKMELLGQLTGGIAHDFNNILASILGFSDLLVHQLQATREKKLLRWAEQIKKSGMRGRDLIKQMLTFSRGGTAQPVPTDPVEVIREVLEMVKVSLPAAITLKTNIDQAVKKVLIDPTQLNQVLLNLGVNASHAVADHGKDGTAGIISVGVTEQTIDHHRCAGCLDDVTGDYVAITVEDNGSGMSSETVEKIFEPFFSTKEVGEGTGMGLAVLHGIIHDCGGHILVNSQLGEGSRFTVLLPGIATTPIKKSSTPDDHQSKTIVVVDDDQLVADMVYRVLQQQGYHVLCFHQPQRAWEEFNRNGQHWGLLITDQNMPLLTGLELTRKIRQRRPHLPIIIHTGYSAELTQALAQELEFVLLEKPVAQKQMLTTIAELLESSGENELDDARSQPP